MTEHTRLTKGAIALTAAALLLLAAPLAAQSASVKLHGHPQCDRYVADDVSIDPGVTCHTPWLEPQIHWADDRSMMPYDASKGLLNPASEHAHHLCNGYFWGEVTGFMTLRCKLRLFHNGGTVTILRSELASNIVWDDTGSWVPPQLTGDPMGIKEWFYTLTIDPRVGYNNGYWECPHGWNPHGPTCVEIFSRLIEPSGVQTDDSAAFPFYSILDPSMPEICCGEAERFLLRARSTVQSPGDKQSAWGDVQLFTYDYLPVLGPLTTPWTVNFIGQSYGQDPTAPIYFLSACRDMDLHHGVGCTKVGPEISAGGAPSAGLTVTLNPADYTPGPHKLTAVWRADTKAGNENFQPNESIAALIGFDFTVGDGTLPPPLTCQEAGATNVGGPLPCAFPPPPPPPLPDWMTITGVLQRLNDAIRLLLPDGKVLNLGTAVAP